MRGIERTITPNTAFANLSGNLEVLVGFSVEDAGELALRRTAAELCRGIDPASTGAPPKTAEAAEAVGRPQRHNPPPAPTRTAAHPLTPEHGEDWQMVEETPPGYEPGSIRDVQYIEVDAKADVDVPANRVDMGEGLRLSKRKRRVLARQWAKITLEHVGVMMQNTLATILLKSRDMAAATKAAEKVSSWMNILGGEPGGEATGVSPGGLAAGRVPTREEIRQGLSDASDEMEAHLSNIRAFKDEAKGDKYAQIAFAKSTWMSGSPGTPSTSVRPAAAGR